MMVWVLDWYIPGNGGGLRRGNGGYGTHDAWAYVTGSFAQLGGAFRGDDTHSMGS